MPRDRLLGWLRQHQPVRPLWLCRACAAAWPCPAARLSLRIEYADNQVGLAMYLCALMHDAITDRARVQPTHRDDPQEIFTRFLAWTRGGRTPGCRPP
ncbi:hypothetical protein [Micromonospora echinofusca]|uniref:hypothetical protein n=1 Tax=Micromonospora echinofusca TaxID=47858 RepID=UPI0027DAD9FE|nr:hypothetical protein [Micromonospora echinofusca]